MDALAKLDRATQMLAEARDLDDVKHIMDIAEAARTYARAARLGLDAQNHAAEICLMAKRRAGEFLAQLEKDKGGRPVKNSFSGETVSQFAEAVDAAGITPVEASRFQLIASLPEDKFAEVVNEAKQSGKELTSSLVMKAARAEKNANKPAPKVPDGKYRVIYADPPWKYTSGDQHSREEQETTLGTHYGSMTIGELCALPIKSLAHDDAVLFMWTTSPLLEECFDVINAWGFKYKASIVWDKDAHNVGHYVSVRHEFLLICTRGSCTPDSGKLLPSVVKEKRGEHSVKPETFRQMIDSMYTEGKRIELFARRPADGWDVWGNDV
jgi:N6-adenosine-specific RNA methylase IME4